MRAYARAPGGIGANPKLTLLKKRTAKVARPRVLHFGGSNVVAEGFLS
jgi:hypothetical protein